MRDAVNLKNHRNLGADVAVTLAAARGACPPLSKLG